MRFTCFQQVKLSKATLFSCFIVSIREKNVDASGKINKARGREREREKAKRCCDSGWDGYIWLEHFHWYGHLVEGNTCSGSSEMRREKKRWFIHCFSDGPFTECATLITRSFGKLILAVITRGLWEDLYFADDHDHGNGSNMSLETEILRERERKRGNIFLVTWTGACTRFLREHARRQV